jgi:hypothetical protein
MIKNNIIVGVKERAYLLKDNSNTADYNLIFNCWKPIPEGPHDIVNTKDPLFVNAEKNDFHLKNDSPAKGSGDPSLSAKEMGVYGK